MIRMRLQTKILTCLLLSSFIFFCRSSETGNDINQKEDHGFNYIEGSGKGPEQWGQLRPEWVNCSAGNMQSPIDIVNPRQQLSPDFTISYRAAQAKLVNQGYHITLEWTEDAGYIAIKGIQYNLKEVHWHTPTEHTFTGRRFEMELHMVHQSNMGERAVVGVLYDFSNGSSGEQEDPFLAKFIPSIKTLETAPIPVGVVDPRDLGIGRWGYYRYMGSLTTPPCTEGVVWTLTSQVLTVSQQQVLVLQRAVDDGFERNARPLQPLNNRAIVYHPIQQ